MRALMLVGVLALSCHQPNWRNADRSSAGIAPAPDAHPDALVQVYSARAFSWRGIFGTHSWIAVKPKGATNYTVLQVAGWRQYAGYAHANVVSARQDVPDRKWYNSVPELICEVSGAQAEVMIPEIFARAKKYPYPYQYRIWPGPNSNTFVSYVMRHVPGFGVELPPTAIGKDWIDNGKLFGRSETETGFQFSLYGVLGATVGRAEGLEIDVLGLTFGVDVLRPALKLPLIGRLGMKDRAVTQ